MRPIVLSMLIVAISPRMGSFTVRDEDVAMATGTQIAPPVVARFDLFFNMPQLELRLPDGSTAWFILDTGAQQSILDVGAARAAGIELSPMGRARAGGAGSATIAVEVARDVTLHLGDYAIPFPRIFATSIDERLAPAFGRHVAGVLGTDFIQRYAVELDYAARLLRLHQPGSITPPEGATIVPITIRAGHPHVTVRVRVPGRDEVAADFVIDTGASGAFYFTTSFVRDGAYLELDVPGRDAFGTGAGGESAGRAIRLEGGAIALGLLEVADPWVSLSRDTVGFLAGMLGVQGLVGGELLRRFTVWFDYTAGQMILRPNGPAAAGFATDFADLSGLSLKARGAALDSITVERVLPASPAHLAGLEAGDVLETIDGRPIVGQTLEAIRQRFLRAGPIELGYRRAGRADTARFTLAPWPW